MSKLDTILESYEAYLDGDNSFDDCNQKRTKQDIGDLVLELIGDKEPIGDYFDPTNMDEVIKVARNSLRDELIEKVKAL